TISDFAASPAIEEALFIMYRSYDKLGLTDLRDDTLRVLTKNYPNTAFLSPEGVNKERKWWKFWQ
ncbi:MAG: outer membrane protein assembly factor BamD, partial [Janthinobacterium sp.]